MAALPVASRLIRDWCKASDTQEQELAASLGINKGQMSGYLNGRRCPSLSRALEFEQVTGVPAQAWDFVEEPGDPVDLDLRRLSKAGVAFWASIAT